MRECRNRTGERCFAMISEFPFQIKAHDVTNTNAHWRGHSRQNRIATLKSNLEMGRMIRRGNYPAKNSKWNLNKSYLLYAYLLT